MQWSFDVGDTVSFPENFDNSPRGSIQMTNGWQFWALLTAVFAALTAVFAKIGVENVNSDFAILIRTVVVLVVLAATLLSLGEFQPLDSISSRTYLFLLLSGLATGASWICYFRALKIGDASLVAPVDKLSVVMVAIFGAALLGEKLTLVNLHRPASEQQYRIRGHGHLEIDGGARVSQMRALRLSLVFQLHANGVECPIDPPARRQSTHSFDSVRAVLES